MPDRRDENNAGMNRSSDMKKAGRTLLKYCRSYLTMIVIAILCTVGGAVCSVIGPDYISELTDVIQKGISFTGVRINMEEIRRIGLILIGIYVCSMILSYLQHFIMNRVSCKVGYNMRADISKKINRIPLSYYDSHNFGDTLSRVTNDVDMISQSLNQSIGILVTAAATLAGLMMPMMAFIGNFGYVAVCIVGAVLAYQGVISFSVVVAFMIYIRLFTSPLGQIGQGFSMLQSALAASERVDEFLTEPELSDESEKRTKLETIRGKVTFDHVSFGYDPERTIIHDFSMQIKPGQKAVIVGPTGAGKTTLVNLLMRFYEAGGGNIMIDDVPVTDLTRHNIHEIFGMVLQDTWLFQGSIRDNLTYGRRDISDEKLLRICEDCGLGYFIRTLPDGLNTVLDDNVSISAGQKQLLTIARAMVEDAPMLILDEATSSVDTRTEAKIQQAMYKLTENRTSFVIAHRLSTIRDADVIIYMQDGDIKETGTHEQLMQLNGLYAELYHSQFAVA